MKNNQKPTDTLKKRLLSTENVFNIINILTGFTTSNISCICIWYDLIFTPKNIIQEEKAKLSQKMFYQGMP